MGHAPPERNREDDGSRLQTAEGYLQSPFKGQESKNIPCHMVAFMLYSLIVEKMNGIFCSLVSSHKGGHR